MTKASQDFQICTTGTASMNIDDSGTFGSVNYSDCTIGYGDYGVTVDGSLTFSFTPSNATFSFNSVTVTSNSGMSASISGDLSCTYSAGAADCNFSFETSYGGVTYSVTHTSISGDPSSGYTVNYEMSSAAYGTIFVATTNPVTFNCSNGYPDSGSVTFTGANGFSGSIAFNSCTSYTVTVDGVSTPYTW
ncbi:MAG: hypothetical protein U9R57_10340 [Thermodesulfobacteriota bacterium]|nr:hypothetical protein [Thermodesulfobacteriota bacterium]